MAFDDEEDPNKALPTGTVQSTADYEDQDDEEDEIQDFQLLTAKKSKAKLEAARKARKQAIRKGEKDFERHGTQAQDSALEKSLLAMEEALSYPKEFKPDSWVRGWYFPDWWAEEKEEGEHDGPNEPQVDFSKFEKLEVKRIKTEQARRERRKGIFLRHRVVVLESAKGSFIATMGRIIPLVPKTEPAADKVWLLPEEALFLAERGNVDIWWPDRALSELFPGEVEGEPGDDTVRQPRSPLTQDPEDYSCGRPMDLRTAYAVLIGNEGERGTTTLQKYQVYSHLRRAGYVVDRAPPPARLQPSLSALSWELSPRLYCPALLSALWKPILSLFQRRSPQFGPLIHPGPYHSYNEIYSQLDVIPRREPSAGSLLAELLASKPELRLAFHVWRSPASAGTKTNRNAPDFRLVVFDSRATTVPTMQEFETIFAQLPYDEPWTHGTITTTTSPSNTNIKPDGAQPQGRPPDVHRTAVKADPGVAVAAALTTAEKNDKQQNQKQKKPTRQSQSRSPEDWQGPRHLYKRLRHGRRSVLIAVVDTGVVSILRVAEGGFSCEQPPLWDRFDGIAAAAGGGGEWTMKSGGSGGGRGNGLPHDTGWARETLWDGFCRMVAKNGWSDGVKGDEVAEGTCERGVV